jgi:acyl carrier protein
MTETPVELVNGATEETLRESVRAIVLELAPEADDSVADTARLVDDLGYHSLALLELAFTLEDQFDLEPIEEQQARNIATIEDVANHVITELRAR